MPIFESQCAACGVVVEYYTPHAESPDPMCPCGGMTKRLISQFGVVFTGPLSASKYNNPSSEPYHQDGHWGWRVRSSRTGKPEAVWIDSFDKQKQFCREEGLVNPKDLPNGMEATADGKVSGNAGRGARGQWI